MNRLWTMATVSKVAAVLLLASALVATAAPAPDPLGKEAEKWEYCEVNSRVLIVLRPDQPVGGEPAGERALRESVRWITADEVIQTVGWEDMATKMKAPAPKKEPPALSQQMRVFNYLGSQGWELVSYHQGTPPVQATRPVHVWLFKRKVTK